MWITTCRTGANQEPEKFGKRFLLMLYLHQTKAKPPFQQEDSAA
jgi:hypothetical protein